MAVMTHASIHPTADYTALTNHQQNQFDRLMELADDTSDNGEFHAYMLAAAAITGLTIPYGGHIQRCGCSCYCPTVFAPTPDTHVIEYGQGYNLGRVQCDLCADRHPETA